MRVLVVTGSRYGTRHLDDLEHEIAHADLVLHGGAPGVDTQAAKIAARRGVHCLKIKALWDYYGDGGGPKRNEVLAVAAEAFQLAGHDVHYAAYPDARSTGTHDCVRRLTAHSIPGKMRQ